MSLEYHGIHKLSEKEQHYFDLGRTSQWKRVTDELPIIPDGNYGIRVLVCEYDSCYDEYRECENSIPVSRHCGLTVSEVSYSSIRNRDGKILSTFSLEFGEYQFQELREGFADDSDWIPCMDQIVYWMYLPKPPEYETRYNEEKNCLEII